jgi:hypothetical protein
VQDLDLPHAHLCIGLTRLCILNLIQVNLICFIIDHCLCSFTNSSCSTIHVVTYLLKRRFLEMSSLFLNFLSQDFGLIPIHKFYHLVLLFNIFLHLSHFLFNLLEEFILVSFRSANFGNMVVNYLYLVFACLFSKDLIKSLHNTFCCGVLVAIVHKFFFKLRYWRQYLVVQSFQITVLSKPIKLLPEFGPFLL